jgi:hypothetical protein
MNPVPETKDRYMAINEHKDSGALVLAHNHVP